jgi:hypothetical protein
MCNQCEQIGELNKRGNPRTQRAQHPSHNQTWLGLSKSQSTPTNDKFHLPHIKRGRMSKWLTKNHFHEIFIISTNYSTETVFPKKKKIILKFTNPQHNEMSNEIKSNLTLPQPNRAQKLANKLLTSGGNTTTHYNPLIHDNSSLKPSITIVTFLFFSIVIVENGSSPFFSQFFSIFTSQPLINFSSFFKKFQYYPFLII